MILEKTEKLTQYTSMGTFPDNEFKNYNNDVKLNNGFYVIRTASGRKLIGFYNNGDWLTPIYKEEVVDIYKGSFNLN